MAETTSMCLKRPREEEYIHLQEEEDVKRPKSSSSSYNQILSILEEDEEEPNQDLSSLITSLQQEITSQSGSESELASSDSGINLSQLTPSNSFKFSEEDEDDKKRVIRHLLEASDDELGIPNTDNEFQPGGDFFGDKFTGGEFEYSLCDDLWEFEDNTANYYTVLQSDLFL